MNHKGLIYTITAIVILAIMAAIIAFGVHTSYGRTIVLESSPSGAEVWLDGQKIGETPLEMDESFLKRHGFFVGNHSLSRIFGHELEYIEIVAPASVKEEGKPQKLKRGKLTFVTKPSSSAIPQVFDGSKPLNEFGPRKRDIELFMRLPLESRVIAVFNREHMPMMSPDRKITAEVTVFAPPLQSAGVSMSDFKSCAIKTSSDFRKRTGFEDNK